MKRLILTLLAWGAGVSAEQPRRMAFRDMAGEMAFKYRMNAGFPGDVNRTHPAEIESALVDPDSPPTLYGQPVLLDASGRVRPYGAGDDAKDMPFGMTVRPYPTSPAGSVTAPGAAASFGAGTPPTSGVINIARNAKIMVQVYGDFSAVVKGSTVYVRIANADADHPLGGIEAVDGAGDTATLDVKRVAFASVPDENGVTELDFNI